MSKIVLKMIALAFKCIKRFLRELTNMRFSALCSQSFFSPHLFFESARALMEKQDDNSDAQ